MSNEPAPKVQRTHDDFYAQQNSFEKPKDSFKALGALIAEYKKHANRKLNIADWGCAAGAFPYYLKSILPEDNIMGYEFLQKLVDTAKKNFPGISFTQSSILDAQAAPENSFDVIVLSGVLSIFDDVEPVLANILRWTRPGGKIFMHGMFNPDDVDIFVKYNPSAEYGKNVLESGWNIISQKTLKTLLIQKGAKACRFHPFSLSVDLAKNESDPVRSWTETRADGSRIITNGLCLLQPQFIVEIDV